MALILLVLVVIVFTLSYFLLWLIYRKVFESQEQISIALTFVVSIGLVMLFVYPPMVFFYFLFFTLSYIIWWLIYRKLFKSQKHISKFLVVLGSIGLIMFYYTPYSFYLEPSYWEFRNMCKLNELPNNEEKYNKILRYFDTSLDTLDWEELNHNNDKRKWKVTKEHGYYRQGIYEYATLTKEKQLNSRARMVASFLSNEAEINRYNINQMAINISWHTRRYFFDIANLTRYDDMWIEKTLACVDVAKKNYEPKGANNEK